MPSFNKMSSTTTTFPTSSTYQHAYPLHTCHHLTQQALLILPIPHLCLGRNGCIQYNVIIDIRLLSIRSDNVSVLTGRDCS